MTISLRRTLLIVGLALVLLVALLSWSISMARSGDPFQHAGFSARICEAACGNKLRCFFSSGEVVLRCVNILRKILRACSEISTWDTSQFSEQAPLVLCLLIQR